MKDAIIDEDLLTIVINQKPAFEMIFSKTHALELTIGFLFTQGMIRSFEDIIDHQWLADENTCTLTLSSQAMERLEKFKQAPPVKGSSGGSLLCHGHLENPLPDKGKKVQLTADQVLHLIDTHWERSAHFKETGALHSAGLCSPGGLLEYYEDIGRHNAVDKLAGSMVLNQTRVHDKIVTVSCRMSQEIIGKIITTQIPIIISNAAPTLSALKLAEQAGLTVIGFAREKRFNIYTHAHRVVH